MAENSAGGGKDRFSLRTLVMVDGAGEVMTDAPCGATPAFYPCSRPVVHRAKGSTSQPFGFPTAAFLASRP